MPLFLRCDPCLFPFYPHFLHSHPRPFLPLCKPSQNLQIIGLGAKGPKRPPFSPVEVKTFSFPLLPDVCMSIWLLCLLVCIFGVFLPCISLCWEHVGSCWGILTIVYTVCKPQSHGIWRGAIYVHEIYLVAIVRIRVIWVREALDWELGYDSLPSNHSFVFLNYSCGVCGTNDHDPMFTLLRYHQHEVIWIPNSRLELSLRTGSCILKSSTS